MLSFPDSLVNRKVCSFAHVMHKIDDDSIRRDFLRCNLIFVYGTLKPGGFYWKQYCHNNTEDLGVAVVQGSIYHLPEGYPGATLQGRGIIRGNVLKLPNSDLLRQLDELEGFSPNNQPDDCEYTRQLVDCKMLQTGTKQLVWFYHMSAEKITARGGIPLPDGVWDGSY